MAGSFYAIYMVTAGMASFDLIPFIGGTLWTDIVVLFVAAVPLIIIVYFLLGLPIAALLLVVSKIVRGAAYDTNIMEIGKTFSGVRMVRRSAAPALFAISSAGMIQNSIEDALFGTPPSIPPDLQFVYPIGLSLMAALILMPLALALYIPTWLLDDAGIVSHLERGLLNMRVCPHTEGVGRWYSSMLGGFSIVAFPFSMFVAHFYTPFVVEHQPLTLQNIFVSSLWTLGIPVMMMAFIVPVVMLHEKVQHKMVSRLQRFARWLGAVEVKRERVRRTGR